MAAPGANAQLANPREIPIGRIDFNNCIRD